MAEFCLDCWNKLDETNDPESKYKISKQEGFCEGCGQIKPVIIAEKKDYYLYKLRFFIYPFIAVYFVAVFIVRLISLPYLLYKRKMKK